MLSVCQPLCVYVVCVLHLSSLVHSCTVLPDIFSHCLFVQPLHQRLGMQTLGLLLDIEGQPFTRRLPTFLPLLHQCLLQHWQNSGQGSEGAGGVAYQGDGEDTLGEQEGEEERSKGKVEEGGGEEEKEEEEEGGAEGCEGVSLPEEEEGEERVRESDRVLFSCLTALHKMCRECELLTRQSALPLDVNAFWGMYWQ